MLAKSTEHGGCAMGFLSVTTVGDLGPAVFAHELGHSLFNLADEYVEQWRCDMDRAGNSKNTTKNASNPPWKDIIDSVVEGADYCEKGVYRATKSCLMRSVSTGGDFCVVCADAGNRWFEERKLTHPDNECSPPEETKNNCFGEEGCPDGTVCSWNGEDIGYCCRPAFEGTKTCYSDDECEDGQVCAFGGPPKNFFYCTTPDASSCAK
jgi:hypothetical protein